jgi:hypothetical protein
LNQYFGNETGTEQEIISKYNHKLKVIKQNLVSSVNSFIQLKTQSANNTIFNLSTFISKHSFNL